MCTERTPRLKKLEAKLTLKKKKVPSPYLGLIRRRVDDKQVARAVGRGQLGRHLIPFLVARVCGRALTQQVRVPERRERRYLKKGISLPAA